MKKIFISEAASRVGQTVFLAGWAQNRRNHGKIIFIDLRDRTGVIQVVFTPENSVLYKQAERLRNEWVVGVSGVVAERPSGMQNKELTTGLVELQAQELIIYAEAQTPPFEIDIDGKDLNEEVRLKYRYLDLRRERMKKNLLMRHQVILFLRNWLNDHGFTEVETPILTKSTPEGARDYVVPSRLYGGQFYALPQSPQQYKQLLMIGGLEKYFQIARCFRDEDTRGDRQPEFTQLDIEMSFVEREDVMALNEQVLITLVQTLFPEKKIQEIPFPRISYQEAITKYQSDKPDLRQDKNDPNLLAFCWIIDFPFFEKTDEGGWTFTHNPFSAPKPEHMSWLMKKEHIQEILTTQYDVVLNGLELGGGSIRNHIPEALHRVFEIMGYEDERIQNNFGHMIEALSFGAPPHGGIAWGFDRFVMLLAGEPNIREVIAFPKTGDARDLMMDAPSTLDKSQLRELSLEIKNKKS
jgi:aspartyl-tRNA synthetase